MNCFWEHSAQPSYILMSKINNFWHRFFDPDSVLKRMINRFLTENKSPLKNGECIFSMDFVLIEKLHKNAKNKLKFFRTFHAKDTAALKIH
jgi:hypothetical protein